MNDHIFVEMLIQYITDATPLEESLVRVIISHSSFIEMLKEDEEFVGHYPLEYWAQQVLDETVQRMRSALDALQKNN
ncbi:hypothetical protein [Paenibacillus sp. LK1]|uniref:hypothetical protein n=1 Tax=Paenibacillus sp. LK1 TaxID=2053014 RepID=UPI000C1A7292|nr:hypothetical protein [Paenibacillus sp. LK1]PIH59081.1 hypothetical protein CS562_14150 [Paenibacillus sp. LK1]